MNRQSYILRLSVGPEPASHTRWHSPCNHSSTPTGKTIWTTRKKYCEYQQAVAMSRKERVHAGYEQFPKETKRLRYLVSDVTQEGLSAIHSHNPRGLCLWVDELSAWFKNFTRYNNGSEEQFWLSAFNGSTTMSDRKNSQNSIFIKRPFISVVGTIQKRLLPNLPTARGQPTGSSTVSFSLCRNHPANPNGEKMR